MSRPERWWRPATNRRPGQRARARRVYTGKELDTTFDLGYEIGQADEAKRSRKRDDQITRLARAADAAQEGDYSLLDEIAQEQGLPAPGDDPLDVADAADVTPLADVDPGELVADLEAWLRDDAE